MRIVNGTDANENEYPFVVRINTLQCTPHKYTYFQVSLRRNSSHTCGATILNENYILTAAHCVCSNERRLLCLNSDGLSLTCKTTKPQDTALFSIQYDMMKITNDPVNTVNVKQINCHKFDTSSLIYDAAILEVSF